MIRPSILSASGRVSSSSGIALAVRPTYAAGDQGIGVVRVQEALAVGEGLLEQRDRFGYAP